MVNTFLRIFDFFQHRRYLCYGLLAVLTAILLVMVSSLRYNEDIYDFLPMDDDQQKAITVYQDITGGKRVVAMLRMADANSSDRLAEAVDTFARQLQDNEGARHIKDVVSQVDMEKIADVTAFVYRNLPLMLCDSDYVRMERILSDPQLVDDQLARDLQMIMMPATGYFATNISYDPMGLFTPLMGRLQQRQQANPFEVDNGYVFTPDKQYAIVMMTSAYGSMESANNTLLVNYVDSISRVTMARFPDVDVAITGSPVIAVDNANQIKADSRLAILISVVLILCLLVFSFRSARHLLLIGVSILFGWLFAMAFIAVFRSNVSLIVLGIGSIIIGIAVNYPLHFIAHIGHGGSTREVLKDMVSPLLIGNITTVGAFAALIPLDAPALRDLGMFAAFMLIGTILFVLVFLPHLVSRKEGKKRKEYLLFSRLSSISPRIHGWMFWVIVLLTVVFGYYSLDTSFDANMHHINYLTPTQQRLMSDLHISAGVNDSSNVYVVAEGNTWDEALAERSRMTPIIDSLRSVRHITHSSDITDFICSRQEQQRRIQLWTDFWASHREQALQLLQTSAARHGFSPDAFGEFETLLSGTYDAHPFEYFEPLVSVLFNRSFSNSTGRCSVVDIVEAGSQSPAQVEQELKAAGGSAVYAFDFIGMNSAVANSLSSDFNYIGFACGLIVFLFLWLSFGRLELSLLAFLPMAVGWLWILGIMNIFGMQFNIVNVILATFIFGQGDDYTIFMADGLLNEHAYRKKILPSYKNSIIISALIMFIGMGSLIVARHPALHSLAEVTIVGMLTVVLMAWIVPPMIFDWLVKTGGRPRRSPVTIEKFIRTTYCSAVYLFEILYGCLFGLFVRLWPWRKQAHQAWLHRVIWRTMRCNINHIWGVQTVIHNDSGEDFNRGSIVVSNHQSILDPILMLATSPYIQILISERVWNNPIVHFLFKIVGFINLNQPMESLKREIGKAVSQGYNVVIFPEGKRNEENITRFHKGAFYIAQELGADILPVFLHGAGHVMPKGSGFATRGRIDVMIGQRIPASELAGFGDSHQLIAHHFQERYSEQNRQVRQSLEDTHYFRHLLIDMYLYKGIGVERETRHLLRKYDDFSQWIDGYKPSSETHKVAVLNAGNGQFAMLFALVHPETEVWAYAYDPDDAALAAACHPMPANLHISYCPSEADARQLAADADIFNLPLS